jgi:hypothetical protein
MRKELKLMLAFIVAVGIFYMFLVSGLSVGISRLNTARDEELRAATLQLEMTQRLSSISKGDTK